MSFSPDSTFIVAWSSVSTIQEAKRISHACVESGLVACVKIVGPVDSVFMWEDEVRDTAEWQLMLKMPSGNLERVHELITALHSYDVPEWIVQSVSGSMQYANWVNGFKVKD